MRRLFLLLLSSAWLIAVNIGCASTTPSKAPSAATDTTPPPGPRPLIVGPATATAAPWLQGACASAGCTHSLTNSGELIAYSGDVGVLETRAGHLMAASRRGRVVGPLAVPGKLAELVALSDGRLIMRLKTGELWAAASPTAALTREGWKQLDKVPSTKSISAAGLWVAYIDAEGRAFVGEWKDATQQPQFRPANPKTGRAATQIAVRADGLVAIMTASKARTDGKGGRADGPKTYLRLPGKKRWTPSTYEPAGLSAVGQVIRGGDSSCIEVLAQDGKRWLHTKDAWGDFAGVDRAHHQWKELLGTKSWPSGVTEDAPAENFEASAPKADEFKRHIVTGRSKCLGGFGGLMGGLMGDSGCKGARCLIGSLGRSPRARPFAAGLFGDGRCPSNPEASGSDYQCADAAKRLTRAPTVALGDRATGQIKTHAVPKGCMPRLLRTVGGLAVLVCAGKQPGRASIFTASHQRPDTWAFEGTAAGLSPYPAMGADGTLLFQRHCPRETSWGGLGGFGGGPGGIGVKGKKTPVTAKEPVAAPEPAKPPCEAWVRRPTAAGTPDSWRRVIAKGAVAYRVGRGGHLLALRIAKKVEREVQLVPIDETGKAGPGITVGTGPKVIGVEVQPDGTVIVEDKAKAGHREPARKRVIMTDGTLRPVPDVASESPD